MAAKMQFGSFVWPNNPETLRVSLRRDIKVTARADKRWNLQNNAFLGRVIEGEGVFYGSTAYATFSSLALRIYSNEVQLLTLPNWQSCNAVMTNLEVVEGMQENCLRYRFTLQEAPETA